MDRGAEAEAGGFLYSEFQDSLLSDDPNLYQVDIKPYFFHTVAWRTFWKNSYSNDS